MRSCYTSSSNFSLVRFDLLIHLPGDKSQNSFFPAISRLLHMSEDDMAAIITGINWAGSLIMIGIGDSDELQKAIDIGLM